MKINYKHLRFKKKDTDYNIKKCYKLYKKALKIGDYDYINEIFKELINCLVADHGYNEMKILLKFYKQMSNRTIIIYNTIYIVSCIIFTAVCTMIIIKLNITGIICICIYSILFAIFYYLSLKYVIYNQSDFFDYCINYVNNVMENKDT